MHAAHIPSLTLPMLMVLAGMLPAADLPPVLFGEWVVAGDMDLSVVPPALHGLPPQAEACTISIAAGTISMKTGDEVKKSTYTVLAEKPEGFQLEIKEENHAKQKSRIVVLADGIVICESLSDGRGMKLRRADGKPPGLPPSVQSGKPPADPAAAPAGDAGRFTVMLNSLSINQNISFQEGDTADASFNASGSLSMRLRAKGVTGCVGQAGDIVWQELVTDAGESLIPVKEDEAGQHRFGHHPFGNGGGHDIWINGSFRAPTRMAKAIKHMQGTIPVTCEVAPAKPLEFKPVKDWIGHAQKIPGTSYAITLVSAHEATAKFRYPSMADALIKDIQLLTEDGSASDNRGSSSTGGGKITTAERTYADPIPPDGCIRIRLVGETAVVQVPFSYSNLPLVEPPEALPAAPNF